MITKPLKMTNAGITVVDKKSDPMIMSLNPAWGSCVVSGRDRGVERDRICARLSKDW